MFKFQAKTKLVWGQGTLTQLSAELRALEVRRVLVVTDPGLVKAGLLDLVEGVLREAGIEGAVFADIEPNPTDETIMRGATALKESGATAVVALGGGSPIDAAKGIAVMASNPGNIVDYCGAGMDPWPERPAPIVAVPTTAGTGAEVSAAGMINVPSLGRKMDIFGPSILPVVAILDPAPTVGLPPRLTALTGLDAFSHAVEAYVCNRANPVSDAIAERAMVLVVDNIRQATVNGRDLEARENMLLASAMAVIAASNAGGLGVIHSLAQTLGGYYNLPHGLTIAVSMPYGLDYNALAVPDKYATVAQILGADVSGMNRFDAARQVVPAMQALLADLAVHDDYVSMGVRQDDIPELSELAMLDGCTPPNPRPISKAGFVKLFQQAFDAIV